MFEFICKSFIKNYDDVNDKLVREKYGTVFSIVSIIFNCILVVFKLIVSFITNSVSIRADALNNLSDMGSNLATFCGFKLANKHADADHPYGHGRIEYVSGMIVAFLILLMGFESLKEAIGKIANPQEMSFSIVALIILIVSILIKLLMMVINKKAGNKIKSDTLLAASQDSFNDSIMTAATLVSLLINYFFNLNLDAYIGIGVSILVLKSGVEIFKNVLDTILGQAPDKELIKEILLTIKAHKKIKGIHDIMFHDYGLSARILSLHVEVDKDEDIIEIHDEIDNIEKEILEKFNVLTTIHMDPIDYTDTRAKTLAKQVKKIVKEVNGQYSIHDFRIVSGPTHTNLVFDVMIPVEERTSHEEIREKIMEKIMTIPDGPYRAVINIEHGYLNLKEQ